VGLFYGNLTVYAPQRPALLAELRRLGRVAFVGPTEQGYTVVYDRAVDEQDAKAIERLGRAVTGPLACSALAAALHDGDVLYLWLFHKGRVRDRYDSCPSYFDPRATDSRRAEGGNARLLCEVFGRPDRHEHVERLLRADLLERELPGVHGELERHAALAAELGMPREVAGLGYSAIAGGYVDEEFRGIEFEAVQAAE
jgi:hypothetical protein